jgi:hypothetical protein
MFQNLLGQGAVEQHSIQAVSVLLACFNEGTWPVASKGLLGVLFF